jgi:DNA (cytosine-5)-methyltransferase 1
MGGGDRVKILDLFAGIGGFSYAAHQLGWQTVAFVEKEPFCQRILANNFPGVPIYDDVRNYNGTEHTADIVCGGFPCQDVSTAGKAEGIDGERSSLYVEMLRIIRNLRPQYVVVENVAGLLGRGLGRVLGEFSQIGYDAEWRVFSACEFGLPHTRQRMFIIAYPNGKFGVDRFCLEGCRPPTTWGSITEIGGTDRDIFKLASSADSLLSGWSEKYRASPLVRNDDGIPDRLDRIKALGNSIVPQIAYEIFWAIQQNEELLTGRR